MTDQRPSAAEALRASSWVDREYDRILFLEDALRILRDATRPADHGWHPGHDSEPPIKCRGRSDDHRTCAVHGGTFALSQVCDARLADKEPSDTYNMWTDVPTAKERDDD